MKNKCQKMPQFDTTFTSRVIIVFSKLCWLLNMLMTEETDIAGDMRGDEPQ